MRCSPWPGRDTANATSILREFLRTITFPGFWSLSIRDWKTGVMEINRSLRKGVFVKDLQRMIPEVRSEDLGSGGSGVRAQAVDRKGNLLDDFRIERSENAIHVLNAPSPGATSSSGNRPLHRGYGN